MSDDRITARQIDIVDAEGTCRASLTAGDDLEGTRIAPFAGLIIRDATGKERGGIGVVDVAGGNRVACVMDHGRGDALGSMVTDSGDVLWVANEVPADPEAALRTRVMIRVTPGGSPSVSLLDDEEHPRVRLTLTESGAGALEFLRADGSVAQRLAPEEDERR